MSLMAHLRGVWRLLREATREWSGDADYARYVQRCRANGTVPLDRGRYFAARLEERYRGGARCC